jgi:RHS repeat-associated protein
MERGDPFGFGAQWGYYTDTEMGLSLLTWRHYDPASGRFLTRDPIGYAGRINLYGYVGNNPANFIDPLVAYPRKVVHLR